MSFFPHPHEALAASNRREQDQRNERSQTVDSGGPPTRAQCLTRLWCRTSGARKKPRALGEKFRDKTEGREQPFSNLFYPLLTLSFIKDTLLLRWSLCSLAPPSPSPLLYPPLQL
ncbi:unnamed protein product, partial [Laminaria digitata]